MWVKTTDIPSLPCWLYCYRRHLFIYGSPWESSPCQVPVSSYSLLSQFKNSKVLLERGRDDERGGVRWVQSRDSVIAIKITLHMGRCRVNTTAKKKKIFASLITGDSSLTKSRIGTTQSARRNCTIIVISATGILLVFGPPFASGFHLINCEVNTPDAKCSIWNSSASSAAVSIFQPTL